jgi:hypothetical protein
MSVIDWNLEHKKYVTLALPAARKAAMRAFWHYREHKREEAIQECLSKVWDSWSRCVLHHGKRPETMIGSLIKFAILWVRYDRRIAGRARTPDVFDFRSGFKQQLLGDDGQACPSDRADAANAWINWEVSSGDSPLDLAAALEETGISLAQWCDL